LINDLYCKYKNIIFFNSNIIVAAIITAALDVFIVSYVSSAFPSNYIVVSVMSMSADFAIYNFSFAMLFFVGNRNKYRNQKNGIIDWHKIKRDSIKLVAALGLAEIMYLSTKFASTYVIFAYSKIDPSQISVITTMLGWIFYVTTANVMVRKTSFFK
jgi:hypothetical protein